MDGALERLGRERDGRIAQAWLTEAWHRSGKDFPRTLNDALGRKPKREPQPQMSEDELFRNLDRHLNRVEAATRRLGARRPSPADPGVHKEF